MEVVKGMEVINIELKTSLSNFNQKESFKLLFDIIKAYKCQEKTMISCFNHVLIKEFKEEIRDIKTAILYSMDLSPEETVAMAKSYLADYINPHHGCVNKEIVSRCKANGIGTNLWTVDGLEDIKRAIEMEPSGIITNVPDVVLKALGR